MTVYSYIAQSNPDAANAVCQKYGYLDVKDLNELAYCLEESVATNGEPALKDIMELHPDKDTIIELFDKKKVDADPEKKNFITAVAPVVVPDDCSCKNSKLGADGSAVLVNKTNLYILGGAILIAFTIMLSVGKRTAHG